MMIVLYWVFIIAAGVWFVLLLGAGIIRIVDHDDDTFFDLLAIHVPWFIRRWYRFNKWMKEYDVPRFSCRQIITFERTAPRKWELIKNNSRYANAKPFYYFRYTNERVGVKTILDYWLLTWYFKNRDKKHCRNNSESYVAKNTAVLLSCFRKDAENAQAEAEKAIREQEQKFNEILARLTQK